MGTKIYPKVIPARELRADGRFHIDDVHTDVVRPVAEGLFCYYVLHVDEDEYLIDAESLKALKVSREEVHKAAVNCFYRDFVDSIEMYGEPGSTGAMLSLGLGEETFGSSLILPGQVWTDMRAQVGQDLLMGLSGHSGPLFCGDKTKNGRGFIQELMLEAVTRGAPPLSPWLYRREGNTWKPIERLIENGSKERASADASKARKGNATVSAKAKAKPQSKNTSRAKAGVKAKAKRLRRA